MENFEKPFGDINEVNVDIKEFAFLENLCAQNYKVPLIETCKKFKNHFLNDISFLYWSLKDDKPIIKFKEIDYSFDKKTNNNFIPAPTSDILIKLIKESLEVKYPEVYHKLLFQLNQNKISLIIAGDPVAIEPVKDNLIADSLAKLYIRIIKKQIYYHS